jgi:hypothetical protein
MSVVLRCPSCGTTRDTPGECEACHEAAARYYCTNHTPGRWVDATVCPHCGARFGASAPPLPAPPAPSRARTPAPLARPEPRAPGPVSPDRAGGPHRRWRRDGGPWGPRKPPLTGGPDPEPRDERAAARDAVLARLPELLRDAYRSRRTHEVPRRIPEGIPMGMAFGGCLARLVLLAVLAFITFFVLSSMVGGILLQMFGGY